MEFKIDANGVIKVVTRGTVGEECLGILECLNNIPGLVVEETITNEDFHKTSALTTNVQSISDSD